MQQIVYTDGSCLKNGAGGFAFIILNDENELYYSEGCKETTNNREELKAVIECLDFIIHDCIIYTDSQYVINCASGKWKRKMNLDLWNKFDTVSKHKSIKFEWVKGHSGNPYNEKVDTMARKEAQKFM
jgi:ribonuclease HI